MPGYISEYRFYGLSDVEFIEVAVPSGTDVTSYSVVVYQYDGRIVESYSLGSVQGTFAGQDVYVIDNNTPGFSSTSGQGEIFQDDAIALVDDNGNVLQFISHFGNTVTATEGPASGLTSTEVGSITASNQSLQSDDGGDTYYAQDNTNKGTIPACYAPGARIETPGGFTLVEDLKIGDLVMTLNKGVQPVRWTWTGDEPLDDVEHHQKPVLIAKDAFSEGVPSHNLVVSGQHRIAVGVHGQLDHIFSKPSYVPAKALVGQPGIRHMAGKRNMRWHHFLCDDHCIVRANGIALETLLLGPQILHNLGIADRMFLSEMIADVFTRKFSKGPALPCKTNRQAKETMAAMTLASVDIKRLIEV
ncbi:MAG: Hint domain-containing protein [Arenibacterium sp.]